LRLWATRVLTLNQAFAGFGDPTVIFIATLFVVSDALDSTGVTAWAGQQVISRGGEKRPKLLILICLLVALLTSLISVNGAFAALIPWWSWWLSGWASLLPDAHAAGLLAICVLTVVLGQLISNTATVLIMVPIATVLAADLHVSVLPFMMAFTVAGAASFLTPWRPPPTPSSWSPAATGSATTGSSACHCCCSF
jgi:di/tricarboxylate transporter